MSRGLGDVYKRQLAKRATNAPNGDFIIFDISIHALAKRATKAVTGMPVVFVDFNPRPRKEGDQ